MVKSNLRITDDLPITIKWLKRYRTKIMIKIQINKSNFFFFFFLTKAIQTHQGSSKWESLSTNNQTCSDAGDFGLGLEDVGFDWIMRRERHEEETNG